jgi:hypothetical protein
MVYAFTLDYIFDKKTNNQELSNYKIDEIKNYEKSLLKGGFIRNTYNDYKSKKPFGRNLYVIIVLLLDLVNFIRVIYLSVGESIYFGDIFHIFGKIKYILYMTFVTFMLFIFISKLTYLYFESKYDYFMGSRTIWGRSEKFEPYWINSY